MIRFYELSRFLEKGIERKVTVSEVVASWVSHTNLRRTCHIRVGLLRGQDTHPRSWSLEGILDHTDRCIGVLLEFVTVHFFLISQF